MTPKQFRIQTLNAIDAAGLSRFPSTASTPSLPSAALTTAPSQRSERTFL